MISGKYLNIVYCPSELFEKITFFDSVPVLNLNFKKRLLPKIEALTALFCRPADLLGHPGADNPNVEVSWRLALLGRRYGSVFPTGWKS